MTVTDVYYDPYDYEIDADPYPVWQRLRDEAPVYYNEKLDFWALSRYDDVLRGLLDHESFVSSHGIMLEIITDEPYGIPMMIMMDPPDHTKLRKLVARAFTPRRIADLEVKIAVARERVPRPGRRRGRVRLRRALRRAAAAHRDPVPGRLPRRARQGVQGAHRPEPARRRGCDRPRTASRTAQIVNENGEINNEAFAMIPELMEMRRKDPQDDLLTGLVHAEIEEDDGTTRTLTLEEILAFMQLISSAGTETVARLLGFGVVTLQRFPDQRQLLFDDPSLMSNAVEELMRFEAPSPTQSRWVARDVEYHGVTIPAGSKLSLLNGAADRDERHFPNPDAFDVRRDIDRQLAFGYGAHFCIGAALARMETRVALAETLKRFPTYEIDESRLEFVHTATVRGYKHVPMRVR